MSRNPRASSPAPAARLDGGGFGLSPRSAIRLDDDVYANEQLGLILEKPAGWHFLSIVDFERQIERQSENDELGGEMLRMLAEVSGSPILVVAKWEEFGSDDVICPTIQVYANPRETVPGGVVAEVEQAESAFANVHWKYELEQPVRPMTISGRPAAGFGYRYVMGEGSDLVVRAEARMVYGSFAHFSIGMLGPGDGPHVADDEFARAWTALRIA